jgi:hypothetical protein
MRERAMPVAGMLSIASPIGGGTEVRLDVPLDRVRYDHREQPSTGLHGSCSPTTTHWCAAGCG